MKYGVLIALVLAASLPAAAQDIALMRERLAQPSPASSSTVKVVEDSAAAEAVRRYDQTAKPERIAGYRIRIFFDNGQNARTQALETEARFKSEFPGIPTFLAYENPSYIVTVGNCMTIDEALMLWNRVRKSFTTAFLWRGDIPVRGLLREKEQTETAELPAADSIPAL